MPTILYVCTGNTCRSPMAEAIARRWLAHGGLGENAEVIVASAGVFAADGSPPSPEAINALATLGIEHYGRSRRLTAEMVRQAEVVFCMTRSHVAAVRSLVEDEEAEQVGIELLEPDGDVEDPIGMGQDVYDSLSVRFMELVPRRLKEMLAGERHEDADDCAGR
ncbi:MAG: hypothetical protein JSV91_08675 [Phycisphaerales bacterium]|nr:MAG: hypothetical protein JSV91_08675 [Phycisphaerales bacterium]